MRSDSRRTLVDAGFEVWRIENRGVGASSQPPGPYSTPQMAEDVIAALDALGVPRAHLVGSSMGGLIAQHLLLMDEGRFLTAVLASTASDPRPWCRRLFGLWEQLARTQGKATVLSHILQWACSVDFVEQQPELLAEIEEALEASPMSDQAFLAQLAALTGHDLAGQLGALRLPVAVLAGDHDALIPTELSLRLAAELPGPRWQTVPGGHACAWEQPDAYNAALVTLLRELPSAG